MNAPYNFGQVGFYYSSTRVSRRGENSSIDAAPTFGFVDGSSDLRWGDSSSKQ